ncbi:glycosyltransferase [Faecalimonas sp.]
MDIVIVSQYLRNIEKLEGNNSRFIYLANMLSENGDNEVEIITSNYMHGAKKHVKSVQQPEKFKITTLKEPGYPKNVCLKRFYSHAVLAKNLKKYLSTRKKPDVIYCAIPSLDVAKVAKNYCKNSDVHFIIDIQDLWPEAFKMVFNIPVLSNLIFLPMNTEANNIYKQADGVIAVSQTYVDRAMLVNKKCKKGIPVFLGTQLKDFDFYANRTVDLLDDTASKNKIFKDIINRMSDKNYSDKVRLVYVGTLGASYDISIILSALKQMKEKELSKLEFIIMGDGPRKQEFEKQAKGLPVYFTGNVVYPDMVWLLSRCDIAVNPITHGAAQSIINKHGDYAMAGLPVISTQESLEYRNLVEKYNMGYNISNSSIDEIKDKICELLDDEVLRNRYGKNARKCAEEKFDRKNSYQEIYNFIINEI